MSKFFIITLLLFSTILNAQWFQTSGEASIINDDIESARENALKKAVKNALLFSGGSISSLQQVNNGVLVENKLILNSEGEIKALLINDEKVTDDKIKVEIKVNIEAPEKICIGSQFPKSLSITRFKLNSPEHAIDGRIGDINKQLTQTIFNQLKLSPQTLNIRRLVNTPVKLGEKYNNENRVETLRALATKTDSQYILYGEIDDLSVKFDSKNSLSYWFTDPERHFYLTIYLYDALQGLLISTKQYRTQAIWEYGKHESADLQSKLFWQKEYGQAILALLDNVNGDLEKELQCLQPIAKIISVANNSVQINLGKRNGLKTDDILSLSYSSNYTDQFGIQRSSASEYQGAMKVIEVHEKNALLQTLDKYPLSNIQINDLARIK